MPASCDSGPVTEDRLLGGRVRLTQPRDGFRAGIEPVLLAAAVPARSGQRVLEGGSASGAGLLCLAARVPGVRGVGLEADPHLVALAARNAAANGFPGLGFVAGDITSARQRGPYDHAFANPPYHAAGGTPSPQVAREAAKRRGHSTVADWATALARGLRHRGTLTMILPAGLLAEALTAMDAAGCRGRAVLPLWPRVCQPAKLLLVQGERDGRSPLRLLPGLVLHDACGFTEATEAVLRHACALEMR